MKTRILIAAARPLLDCIIPLGLGVLQALTLEALVPKTVRIIYRHGTFTSDPVRMTLYRHCEKTLKLSILTEHHLRVRDNTAAHVQPQIAKQREFEVTVVPYSGQLTFSNAG